MLITGVEVDYVEAFGDYVSDRKVNRRPLVVRLHPQLAKVLGVKNGDLVIVENKLGSFSAPAWLQNDMDPHVIWIPEIVDMKYSQKIKIIPYRFLRLANQDQG